MQINNELITYLEDLSRLTLSKEEEEKAKVDLEKILNYIDKLNELDTTDVEAISHPFAFTNNFRDDVTVDSTDRDIILANAPMKKDGCFKVPKTVD
ncbi:MAG: Asp-tRNA(Asn)/Glu-tRNA(Gln) amidotransferase subunit GatC [Clostridiales bacterium]|jgi:aspartyl-tRNA(Asn)/glutamyl-tRNA(Gln) amidotransferase subunit C|nr:Asp-tRNA(Asn)/Glu-tRNA(Gln) amidotransferase subunit GatC [Clostridiales bacterium]